MTKERLRKYRDLLRERAQIEAELERLEAEMLAPRGSQLTGMPRGGGGPGNPVERMVAKHVELTERYHAKLERLRAEQLAIETSIDSLEPLERTILRAYYIEGLYWEEVCVKVAYSWRRVHQIHVAALKKLEGK